MRKQFIIFALPFAVACGAALPWLTSIENALNQACPQLTQLPDQSYICAGVQGATVLANLLVQFLDTPTAKAALKEARARAASSPAASLVKVNGLPFYQHPEVARVLNEPKMNAAMLAYISAGLDAGAGG